MQQWIIDRYNKGQKEYGKQINDVHDCYVYFNHGNTTLYNFLFNPKYGFAKAFWGHELLDPGYAHFKEDQCKYIWHYCIQEMAISEDPLKYLEQFKENKCKQ